ncbi:MAG: ABC transporter transmembrane domain-containing protein, partial [Bacteroidota bacterium]|nr:ABC transporter transmembrane domain-containing protein [Bacteroidota bacterium]
MRNPYFSMLGTAWKFARQERRRYILIYAMFIAANIVVAMYPLLYGWFINGLQREGIDIFRYAWMYAGGYIALKVIEWVFHGPARVMERKLAFNLSRNFLEELYHKVLHLPLDWHKDHHSGATINRIKKAYDSLRAFFQNGFIYLYGFCKFFFSFAAIVYFSPLFGSIGVILGLFTIWVISKFDKPYVSSLKEVNEGQHKVSSNLFDCLSNIVSVITLRLEKSMETGLMNKVADIYPAFKRTVTINEWKWFAAQMLVSLIYVIITLGYVYQNWVPGEVFYIGGLITMLGFVMQFTSVFDDIASQYTQVLQYHTDVQTASVIFEEYDKQNRPQGIIPLSTHWENIYIKNLNFVHPEILSDKKRTNGLYDLSMNIN